MGFAHKVNRVTISGNAFAGEEEWSTGFYLGYGGGDADVSSEAMAEAIGALWNTFFTAASTKISSNWTSTQVKIAMLNTNGTTDLDNVFYYNYPAAILGTGAGAAMAPQVSLAATLQSPLNRGLGSKGRMYLPGILALLNSNGRIADNDRLAICTNLRNFLRGVSDNALTANVPVLASKGRPGDVIFPTIREITEVRVGNVYDTQRRRRNGLSEQYSTVAI